MKTKGKRSAPFIRKLKNSCYDTVSFEDLKISTATVDVRLMEDSNIKFDKLFDLLPVVPEEIQESNKTQIWPAGTITGAICANKKKGIIPTLKLESDGTEKAKKGFKNSTMIWMWLNEKRINVKICKANLHMTGCKKIDQAIEATRYIQQHLQVIQSQGHTNIFDNYPYLDKLEVCMINYNFSLGVALNLTELDIFLDKNYPDFAYSPFDPNICNDTLALKVPRLSVTYTVHDNSRVSMCTNEQDVDLAERNIKIAFETFYMILQEYRNCQNINTQPCV